MAKAGKKGKTETVVDRSKFITAISIAEKDGALKNRSVLHEKVAEIYNASQPPKAISAAIVMLRLKQWDLTVKTAIGKLELDMVKFKAAIATAEKDGPLSNLGELYQKVTDLYNVGTTTTITTSIVALRIKEYGIVVQTKAGKRAGVALTAEHKAAMLSGRGQRVSRREKFRKDPEIVAGFQELKTTIDVRFHPLIEKAQKGSMRAAVALKCIDCCNGQTKEIKFCSCADCPLFAYRPYKPKAGETAPDETQVEFEAEDALPQKQVA